MTEINPWKTVSQKIVYRNPWITVREDQVIRPDGEPGIYGVVNCRVATGVVALTDENEVYLVGQYRYAMEQYSWELPEGGADPSEAPLDAIKRELREEAGITASDWQQLGSEIHLSNCHSNERAYLYLARGLTVGASSPDSYEELKVKKLPFPEALAMVQRGEIQDAMTIMGLMMAERLLYR